MEEGPRKRKAPTLYGFDVDGLSDKERRRVAGIPPKKKKPASRKPASRKPGTQWEYQWVTNEAALAQWLDGTYLLPFTINKIVTGPNPQGWYKVRACVRAYVCPCARMREKEYLTCRYSGASRRGSTWRCAAGALTTAYAAFPFLLFFGFS